MRSLIFVIIAFSAGYVIRDYFGPTRLPFVNKTPQEIINPESQNTQAPGNVDIIYENGRFSPPEATIGVSRYLSITNKSNSLMWLESDYPGLSTPRGYGLSEQVMVRVEKPGIITVNNKLNVKASAIIKVVE
ncbi:hypothetical protein ACFL1A_01725 [Patescibacteria group bacterium]